jgi:activator of HSP90 ATPase
MPTTLIQKVIFKNVSPSVLYNFYMNSKMHSRLTGAPANISAKVGSAYTAHGDYITGKNLQLVKDKLIVQSWRASDWDAQDADSTFAIFLEQKGKDTILHAIHVNVPDRQADSLGKGWHDYYWNNWKQFLASKKNTKSKKK